VLLDALIVRSILVPALMLVIGERQWRLPKGLDRLLPASTSKATCAGRRCRRPRRRSLAVGETDASRPTTPASRTRTMGRRFPPQPEATRLARRNRQARA